MADSELARVHRSTEVGAAYLDDLHAALAELFDLVPGVDQRDRDAFVTAVAEIAGNVVEHAAAPHLDGDIMLCAFEDRLEALLADAGPAADLPEGSEMPDDEAESGRGLLLARALSVVEYQRAGERNEWRVARSRS